MSYANFTFGDFNSLDYDLYIDPSFNTTSPKIRGEFVEVSGLDGELFTSDYAMSNTTRSIPVILLSNKTDEAAIRDISANIVRGKWLNLVFSNEPDYIYQAIFTEEFEFEKNILSYGKTVLTFTIKPYKYLKSGLTAITLPTSIKNNTTRIAKPVIRIKGTGTITIKIGSSQLSLKNVDEGVIIDSRAQTITSLNGAFNRYNNMTSYPFPTIGVGNQEITTTGTITECKITPRWEVLV